MGKHCKPKRIAIAVIKGIMVSEAECSVAIKKKVKGEDVLNINIHRIN